MTDDSPIRLCLAALFMHALLPVVSRPASSELLAAEAFRFADELIAQWKKQ